MGIAYSGTPIEEATFSGESAADIIEGIRAALDLTGWSTTAITGGYLFGCTSPQELSCAVRVWHPSSSGSNYVGVQFESSDGARVGYEHRLKWESGREYRIVANACQFFVSRVGFARSNNQESVAGGVPRVPTPGGITCASEFQDVVTIEAWWSMGEGALGGVRTIEKPWEFSACHNAVLLKRGGLGDDPIEDQARLRWSIRTDSYPYLSRNDPEVYWDDQPLRIDAFLRWSDSRTGHAPMRAQLWDGFLECRYYPVDAIQTSMVNGEEVTWRNYVQIDLSPHAHQPQFSLWLLTDTVEGGGSLGNDAY